MPAIASLGCRAWALDLPGHGDSQKPADPGFYSSGAFFTAIEDWLSDLPDQPPYILVGHSLGGYLSLRYALRHPDKVRALVLIDPLFSLNHVSSLLRWIERLPGLDILNAFAVQQVPHSAIQLVLGLGPLNQDRLYSRTALADCRRLQAHLPLPAAPDDQLDRPGAVPGSDSRRPAWSSGATKTSPSTRPRSPCSSPCCRNAQGHPIPGSGHQPHIGQPDLVNQLVKGFIQTHYIEADREAPQSVLQFPSQGNPNVS